MDDVSNTIYVPVILILLVILILSILFFVNRYKSLNICKNSENIVCPSFYCPNYTNANGIEESGTDKQCYDITTNIGNKVAYRVTKNGTIMCQQYSEGIQNFVPKKN